MRAKAILWACIALVTVLLGLGAFWQHQRYVALTEQYKTLVEANTGLAEAVERSAEVDGVKQDVSTKVVEVIVEKTKVIEQQKQQVDEIVAQGTQDEKDFMSHPLPPDLVRVLDDAYQGGNQGGANP